MPATTAGDPSSKTSRIARSAGNTKNSNATATAAAGRQEREGGGTIGGTAGLTESNLSSSSSTRGSGKDGRKTSEENGDSTPEHDDGYGSETSTRSASSCSGRNPKTLLNSNSTVGLVIEERREVGDFMTNIVHMEVPFGKPIEEVYNGVHDGAVLGSGISGLVRLITHKATGVNYAVKCLDLGLVENEEGLRQLREEIFIMCQLDHPNIVRLEEVYESHNEIYLVQELCLGGELFDRLDEQPDYHYTEAQCARLVKQMLSAVRYIHSKGIIHRDLKLENFLFSNKEPGSELKMIDFGLSKHFKFGEMQHEAVGTPYTVAPEVISGSYDERCDVWAIGVITYLLLSGDPPFGGCGGPEPLMQVRSNILSGKFDFNPPDIWQNVSKYARDFINRLLVTDPNGRPTARDAQKSRWLREWAKKDRKTDDSTLINPNVVKSLVSFKEYSDMRKLLCEVLSFTLLPDQIQDLRREFEKMDTDGSGEISLHGLKKVLMVNAEAGSLGALTEEEIEDIFNAMRVQKTETRIHWHEFIAAGLSQCNFDDRNLKLAFDRLDADHKGFIIFEDIKALLGPEGASDDAIQQMWGDSMKACQCFNAQISYEDFLLLMKGQTRDEIDFLSQRAGASRSNSARGAGGSGLGVVHELNTHEEVQTDEDMSDGKSSPEKGEYIILPSGDKVCISTGTITSKNKGGQGPQIVEDSSRRLSSSSLEVVLATSKRRPSMESSDSGRKSLVGSTGRSPSASSLGPIDHNNGAPFAGDDDDEDADEYLSDRIDIMMPRYSTSAPDMGNLTPPESPQRGAADYITPNSHKQRLSPSTIPDRPPLEYIRRRSRSVDDADGDDENESEEVSLGPFVPADIRRAIGIPDQASFGDESQSNLSVNRKIYRAHRQMRLAVLEASKRFEENRVRRTRESLLAQHSDKRVSAGLVLRHGQAKELSAEALRKIMQQNEQQQQKLVQQATKRGGRGRRVRKKTVSDMSGMLNSPPRSGDILADSDVEKPTLKLNKTVGAVARKEISEPLKDALRQPTTPGVFRKTTDPFAGMSEHIIGTARDILGSASGISQSQKRRSPGGIPMGIKVDDSRGKKEKDKSLRGNKKALPPPPIL